MKRIFAILALVALVLTSCEDTKPKNNGKLDPNAKVYISAAQLPQSAQTLTNGEQELLSPLEIVERATTLNADIWFSMGVDNRRDTANVRFIVDGVWAIDMEGNLTEEFITARNLYFDIRNEEGVVTDTIAYVPNIVMINAERDIRKAYAEENYTECYRILEESFVFTPTTGAIFKELKAKGDN